MHAWTWCWTAAGLRAGGRARQEDQGSPTACCRSKRAGVPPRDGNALPCVITTWGGPLQIGSTRALCRSPCLSTCTPPPPAAHTHCNALPLSLSSSRVVSQSLGVLVCAHPTRQLYGVSMSGHRRGHRMLDAERRMVMGTSSSRVCSTGLDRAASYQGSTLQS